MNRNITFSSSAAAEFSRCRIPTLRQRRCDAQQRTLCRRSVAAFCALTPYVAQSAASAARRRIIASLLMYLEDYFLTSITVIAISFDTMFSSSLLR